MGVFDSESGRICPPPYRRADRAIRSNQKTLRVFWFRSYPLRGGTTGPIILILGKMMKFN
jgi:hypothetical protein